MDEAYTVWVRLLGQSETWQVYGAGIASIEAAVVLLGNALSDRTGVIGGCILPVGNRP